MRRWFDSTFECEVDGTHENLGAARIRCENCFTRGAWREPDESLGVNARLSRGDDDACEMKKKTVVFLSRVPTNYYFLCHVFFSFFRVVGRSRV